MLHSLSMLPFKRVGITVKSDLDQQDVVLAAILKLLSKENVQVCIDDKRRDRIPGGGEMSVFTCPEDIDLLLVIGGDGTILRTVRELQDFSVPILTVNRGAVGFLAEMTVEEAPELLPMFIAGKGWIEERRVLDIRAERSGAVIHEGFVLNEAVISQGSIARLVDLKTTVNGEELTTFRADGLIIATPTGSTAYTLAAGGPIVHPEIGAAILTPINSHSFSQKPIVIPASHRVEVEVFTKANKFGDVEVSLTLDGQTYVRLQRHDRITAMMAPTGVRFLRRSKETFYGTLRQKLKWGERPED